VWLVSGFAGVGIVMIEECVEIVINVSTVNQWKDDGPEQSGDGKGNKY